MIAAVFGVMVMTAAAPPPSRVALVIGVNAPLQDERALRFADDDALKTSSLLQEAGVEVVTLTQLDADTQGFLGDQAPLHAPATLQNVRRHLARWAEDDGVEDFYIFYSGHGGVDEEQGFITLEDGRFGRDELQAAVTRVAAQRKHIIIDACKSYFMAFGRGPGGERTPLSVPFPQRSDNIGFVLSTSSDRDSHEWGRFQSGVFSHEVRSGLRGAADINGDGNVGYDELLGFVQSANAGIRNPSYRPDVYVRAPQQARDAALLSWPAGSVKTARDVLILDVDEEHLLIEDALGVRLVDVHPGNGVRLALHVPARRPLFVRSVRRGTERAAWGQGPLRVSTLPEQPAEVTGKSALSLAFRDLFRDGFETGDVERAREALARPDVVITPGVNPSGAGTAGAMPETGAPYAAMGLSVVGAAALVGALAAAGGAFAFDAWAASSRNSRWDPQDLVAPAGGAVAAVLVGGALAAGAGAMWLLPGADATDDSIVLDASNPAKPDAAPRGEAE